MFCGKKGILLLNKKVLITGFGPFGDVKENPSQKLLKSLNELLPQDKFICEVLPVSYSFCEDWILEQNRHEFAFVLHFGVAMKSEKIRLEKKAKNFCGEGKDITGFSKTGLIKENEPKSLVSQVNTEHLAEWLNNEGFPCEVSEDAGDYLCNFLYFISLLHFSGNVLFVHIPSEKVVAIEELIQFTKALLRHLQFQVK